jgi:putative colanic acid biosynthesis acetyltransferase WcaF
MAEKYEKYVDVISFRDKINRFIWAIVCFFFFKPFFFPFMNRWRVFLLKMFGAKIGNHTIIHSSVFIPSPWNLDVGVETCIGPEVKLHFGKTIIGSKVTISQRTYLCSASHEISSLNTPFIPGEIIIEDFVWIAAEVFVMMNITIGEGAVVGARAAIFKNVEPWTVVGGNPAKFIKKRMIYE